MGPYPVIMAGEYLVRNFEPEEEDLTEFDDLLCSFEDEDDGCDN